MLFYGTLSFRIHAASQRIFTSSDGSGCSGDRTQEDLVDLGFMARLDFVRWHAAVASAGVCAGPGALESTRHLSLCRCIRRNGASLAGDDPRLRRSRSVRTLQMAVYFSAAVSSRSLHGLLLVGSERNLTDCFLLGRLAWTDANVRLLPHLRCENRNLRRADAPPRFRHVRDLVRDCRGALSISAE